MKFVKLYSVFVICIITGPCMCMYPYKSVVKCKNNKRNKRKVFATLGASLPSSQWNYEHTTDHSHSQKSISQQFNKITCQHNTLILSHHVRQALMNKMRNRFFNLLITECILRQSSEKLVGGHGAIYIPML